MSQHPTQVVGEVADPRVVSTVEATTLDELVNRARSLMSQGARSLLGITGTPGAGKSVLCAAMIDALGGDAVLVGMDGFHFANDELVRLGRAERKGAFDTFDVDGYVALLDRLRHQQSGTVYAPVFDRGIDEPLGSAIPVAADVPLVITEGNYLLLQDGGWATVRSCLDEVWFLDVEPPVREQRLVLRRQSFGHAPAAARAWVTAVDERNADVVAATRDRADLLVHLSTRPGTIDAESASPASSRDERNLRSRGADLYPHPKER